VRRRWFADGKCRRGDPRRGRRARRRVVMILSERRRQPYRLAGDLGNAQAASRGAVSCSQLVLRPNGYRTSMGVTRKLTKDLGL
jgi:hypothetical protein